MSVNATRVRGNLLYTDGRKKLIDAFGPDVVKFDQDFIGVAATSDALVGWTTTLVEAGTGESTVTIVDGSAGELLITTDNLEDDGVQLQKIAENFGFAATQYATYFGIRLKSGEATQDDFIVGLCITDTTLLGGMTDGVYFRKVDGSAAVEFVTEKDSTETATAAVHTLVADTYVVLEFYFDGTTVEAFVNGTSVASHSANIPNDELLTPSIAFLTGNAAVETMTVDWVRAIQVGR